MGKKSSLPSSSLFPFPFPSFFIFPSQESVDESERVHHQKLMEVIGWFFFDLLILGYVEDFNTGLSFRIPGGKAWAIYVEVCVCVFRVWNEDVNIGR